MVTLLGEKELAILFFRCENIWCASYCYFMSAYCMCGILKLNCIFNSKTFYLFSFSERFVSKMGCMPYFIEAWCPFYGI